MPDYGSMMFTAGGLIGGASDLYSAYTSVKTAGYEADILQYQAEYNRAVNDYKATVLERDVERTIASQRAAAAARGVRGSVGSPFGLQVETGIMGEIDAAILRINGNIDNLALNLAARSAKARGYAEASQASASAFGTFFDTGLQMAHRKGLLAPKNKSAWMDKYTWNRSASAGGAPSQKAPSGRWGPRTRSGDKQWWSYY